MQQYFKYKLQPQNYKICSNLNLDYSRTCSNCPYEQSTSASLDYFEAIYELLDYESDDVLREIAQTHWASVLKVGYDYS